MQESQGKPIIGSRPEHYGWADECNYDRPTRNATVSMNQNFSWKKGNYDNLILCFYNDLRN